MPTPFPTPNIPLPPRHRRPGGYTLIEIILVMGIIIMIITLVLISVAAMLRTSKMSRAVNLVTAAVDEARTAAITIRRTTRVDVTPLDTEGKVSRMTVFGTGVSDNFEEYSLPDVSTIGQTDPAQDPTLTANWKSTSLTPQLVADGSRCMKARGLASATAYWNPGLRVDAISVGDYYEAVLFARIKILPGTQRKDKKKMNVGILGSINDGGGSSIKSAYALMMNIVPDGSNAGRNASSSLSLNYFSGISGSPLQSDSTHHDGPATLSFDTAGTGATSSPTALLVESVWYRVLLSVKSYTPTEEGSPTPRAIVAGKVWADGQLEPLSYSVGPVTVTDSSKILSNGFGGFSADGCDILVDDVLFDLRPLRLIPQGITMTALDPDSTPAYQAANQDSKYSFPLMFRPDGTTTVYSIIEIADSTTKNKRYVRIEQNTGRARVGDTLDSVKNAKDKSK